MEYKYENGHIIPINNSISNKRLDRLEEVVKTLSPEGGVLTKEDIAEVAVKAEKALKTANTASNELSTFKTNVSNTYAKTSDIPSVQGLATIEYVNKAINVSIVEQTNSVVTILPNVLNVWGEVATLNITLAEGAEGVVNEYMVQFISGATATTLTLPDSIVWMSSPNIQANKTYQLSIINNLGIIGEFSNE